MTPVSFPLTVGLKFWNCPAENDSWVEPDSSNYSILDHDSDNDIMGDHGTMAFQTFDAPITYMLEHGVKDKEWVGEGQNGFVEFATDLSGSLKDLVDFDSD